MKCRVLERKLGFLMRVMAGDMDSLSRSVLLAMCDDVESICLVRECKEMEEHFGTHFTSDILKRNKIQSQGDEEDYHQSRQEDDCGEKAPMIAKVAESPGWAKLWDHTLDLGWKAVQGLKMLSRAISYHGKSERPCHLCESDTEN